MSSNQKPNYQSDNRVLPITAKQVADMVFVMEKLNLQQRRDLLDTARQMSSSNRTGEDQQEEVKYLGKKKYNKEFRNKGARPNQRPDQDRGGQKRNNNQNRVNNQNRDNSDRNNQNRNSDRNNQNHDNSDRNNQNRNNSDRNDQNRNNQNRNNQNRNNQNRNNQNGNEQANDDQANDQDNRPSEKKSLVISKEVQSDDDGELPSANQVREKKPNVGLKFKKRQNPDPTPPPEEPKLDLGL